MPIIEAARKTQPSTVRRIDNAADMLEVMAAAAPLGYAPSLQAYLDGEDTVWRLAIKHPQVAEEQIAYVGDLVAVDTAVTCYKPETIAVDYTVDTAVLIVGSAVSVGGLDVEAGDVEVGGARIGQYGAASAATQ